MTKITIKKVNYFGEATGTHDFNAKMLYIKNGKQYLAHLYISFFSKEIYEGRNNPKEHKMLKGALAAVRNFAIETKWRMA